MSTVVGLAHAGLSITAAVVLSVGAAAGSVVSGRVVGVQTLRHGERLIATDALAWTARSPCSFLLVLVPYQDRHPQDRKWLSRFLVNMCACSVL